MKDAHALPGPIVPHGWDKVDTSIDQEPVTRLADHLFAKHVETTRKLLTLAGLHVYSLQEGHPEVFVATDEDTHITIQVTMRGDRGAEYELILDGEIPDPSGARDTATEILALLTGGLALEKSQHAHQAQQPRRAHPVPEASAEDA